MNDTDMLTAALTDEREARKIAAESADRFRDVLCEVLDLPGNPGDDELVRLIRDRHGKKGPEPRRWRDFITGAVAHLEHEGFRWLSDYAEDRAQDRTDP